MRYRVRGSRNSASARSAELALALGRAAVRVLGVATVVVGRDTRRSGPLLQAALSAGMASEGADVVDLGVLPTPGVAHLSERRHCTAAMVSASHNPFSDNGIKLFGAGGGKLAVEREAAIEAAETLMDPIPDIRGGGDYKRQLGRGGVRGAGPDAREGVAALRTHRDPEFPSAEPFG